MGTLDFPLNLLCDSLLLLGCSNIRPMGHAPGKHKLQSLKSEKCVYNNVIGYNYHCNSCSRCVARVLNTMRMRALCITKFRAGTYPVPHSGVIFFLRKQTGSGLGTRLVGYRNRWLPDSQLALLCMPESVTTNMDQPAEKSTTCSICLEEFLDPKLLPCCHTFCAKCLEGLITKHQPEPASTSGGLFIGSRFGLSDSKPRQVQDEITCPQCGTCHVLPSQGGVCGLLTDYTVVQEQEKRQWQSLLQRKDACGMCEQSGVTISFCEECECFLCSYCADAHQRMKIFNSHHVSSLSSPEFPNIKPKPKPVACQIHPDHCVSFYCATCCQLICNKCVATPTNAVTVKSAEPETFPSSSTTTDNKVVRHQSHVLHTLSDDSLISLQAELDQLLTSASKQIEQSQEEVISIECKGKKLTAHSEQLKKALDEQVEQHIKELREYCEHNLKKVDEKHTITMDDCKAEISALTEKIHKLTTKKQFASKAQNCNGQISKIAMTAMAISELRKLELTPASQASFDFFMPGLSSSYSCITSTSALNEVPLVVRNLNADLKKAGLTRVLMGSDFTCSVTEVSKFPPMSGGGTSTLQLGKKSQLLISASVKPIGVPEFKVLYGKSERVLKTTVQQKTDGSWLLECTPTCIGIHKITICVFGYLITTNIPKFTVEGTLNEGDIVRRGPDPNSTAKDFLESKGEDIKMASQYEVGKLTSVIHSKSRRGSPKYELEVTWGHESEKPLVEEIPSSTWNEVFGFPIELAL